MLQFKKEKNPQNLRKTYIWLVAVDYFVIRKTMLLREKRSQLYNLWFLPLNILESLSLKFWKEVVFLFHAKRIWNKFLKNGYKIFILHSQIHTNLKAHTEFTELSKIIFMEIVFLFTTSMLLSYYLEKMELISWC